MAPINDNAEGSLVTHLLQEVLSEVKSLTTQITLIQIDHERTRGDFTSQLLHQANNFDAKMQAMERRLHEKMAARSEKVDGWFDSMQAEFSKYQTTMESRITGISVRVGLMIGGLTLLGSAIVTAVIKYAL
jgi:hypothetical protein